MNWRGSSTSLVVVLTSCSSPACPCATRAVYLAVCSLRALSASTIPRAAGPAVMIVLVLSRETAAIIVGRHQSAFGTYALMFPNVKTMF